MGADPEAEIRVPDAPSIAGLTFRRFRGEVDFPQMLEVMDRSRRADKIEMVDTLEDLKVRYAHLKNSDPFTDMLFAEVDGRLIAFSRVEWSQEVGGPRVYASFGFVLPEWRRRGLGRAMLRFSERRLHEIALTHEVDCERFLQAFSADTAEASRALLERGGYKPVRYFFDMVREGLENLPEAPLPEGFEVRSVKPEHYRAIWEADVESFRDHWGFSEPAEVDYQRWLKNPYFDPSLWRVAWEGDQVAGQVKSFINHKENSQHRRRRGYTEDIAVGRKWRRRGLASALIVMSFRALRERGMTEAALGVDSENQTGALGLYERLGFRVVKEWACYRKAMPG